MRKPVMLGDYVKDPVTEIEGLAYGRVQWLQGCDRIRIQQATIFEKGKEPVIPDLYEVDEPQLIVKKRGKVKGDDPMAGMVPETKDPVIKKRTGGPSHFTKRVR